MSSSGVTVINPFTQQTIQLVSNTVEVQKNNAKTFEQASRNKHNVPRLLTTTSNAVST